MLVEISQSSHELRKLWLVERGSWACGIGHEPVLGVVVSNSWLKKVYKQEEKREDESLFEPLRLRESKGKKKKRREKEIE